MRDENPLHSAARRVAASASYALEAPPLPGDAERTSFRLSPAAADARDWLVNHLAEPQRALLDRAAAYLDAAVKAFSAAELRPILNRLAEGGLPEGEGERKTYLVSTHTLRRLNRHADRLGVARDALVAFALLGVRLLLEEEAGEARGRRAAVLPDVAALADRAGALEGALCERLGPDDPAARRLAEAATLLATLADDLEEEQRAGRPLSPQPRPLAH